MAMVPTSIILVRKILQLAQFVDAVSNVFVQQRYTLLNANGIIMSALDSIQYEHSTNHQMKTKLIDKLKVG
ncbi:hypothetical protein QTP88_007597 [Uroleucon formosanum]